MLVGYCTTENIGKGLGPAVLEDLPGHLIIQIDEHNAVSFCTLLIDLPDGPELPNDAHDARRNGAASSAAVLIKRRFSIRFKSILSRPTRGL